MKKAVWLFAGGPMQAVAAKKIKDDGYQLILTDMNSDCYCARYADEFIALDTFDIQANLKIAALLKNKYIVKAVVTIAADCHGTVAHIAKYLNLSGIDPGISRTCRLKYKTRAILTKAGLSQPRFEVVNTIQEAKKFASDLNLPVVMKATDNSGSRGFSFIESSKAINDENFKLALNNGSTGKVLIEELLIPLKGVISEQSVETLWVNGKMYWLNWVDRIFRSDIKFLGVDTDIYDNLGWAVELGHINPAIHERDLRENVEDLIYRAGIAIGSHKQKDAHILKADIMLTDSGPIILELTPRLSGGWDSSGTTPARGADFIGGAIEISINKKINRNLIEQYFSYKHEELFSAVVTEIKVGSTDNIGRKFSIATAENREKALGQAFYNLRNRNYVVSVE